MQRFEVQGKPALQDRPAQTAFMATTEFVLLLKSGGKTAALHKRH